MMKKLLLLLMSVWSLQIFAQTDLNVVFKQVEAADITISLDNLDRIVFQENKMIYYLNNGTDCSIDLDSFLGFLVTLPTEAARTEADDSEICFDGTCLNVAGCKDEILKIYSLSNLVKVIDVESEIQSFDLSDMQHGFYIAVIGTNVIEFVK